MNQLFFLFTLTISFIGVSNVNSQTQIQGDTLKKPYLLPPLPSYVILAPRQVRPFSTYQASITVFKMLYPSLTIRLTIKDDSIEYSHGTAIFKNPGTQVLRLEIPERAMNSSNYFMEAIGSLTENGAIIFSNRTKIEYNPRQHAVFIQMSSPIYRQSQIVRFRVIPVNPDLMPKLGTTTYIQLKDANGFVIKRWFSPATNVGGIFEMEFPLADQITEGTWHIEYVTDKWSQSQPFEVREYWAPRYDVNVTIPVRFSELGFGVFGILSGNETSGMPVKGQAWITLTIRDPTLDRFTTEPLIKITREIYYFDGRADFTFTMSELKAKLNQGSLADKDVWVNASVYNRFEKMNRTGWAYSFIYSDKAKLKLFGGMVRPYKPDMPFNVYMSVSQPDMTPPGDNLNRRVELRLYCDGTEIYSDQNIVVPDTGIIKKTLNLPKMTCMSPEIRATYKTDLNEEIDTATQSLFEYQSYSRAYMQITMATDSVRVNEYAVFYVEMSYPTNQLYYQIISQGNIVYVDTLLLDKPVKTRTISLAISREMAPVARLVAFFVKTDGEIVSDSITFFVNITNINNVDVKVNRGKDLNVDTVEINGYGEPGAYLALNVLHYDLYKHGADNILRDYNVISQLMQFEIKDSQLPYQQDWYHDLEYIERTYVPAPSSGADTNSTFYNAGLNLYTDAEFVRVNFNHDCNETQDKSKAFPCYTITGRQCYSRDQRCNGIADCATKADEAGCPEVNTNVGPQRKDMMIYFQYLYRHYLDSSWLWKSYWIKPNGRINFRVDLPKIDTSWVLGAFAVDRLKGFSIIDKPALFSGVRRFFMVVEAPEEAIYGEQIGVRITLFNYWDYWTEALLIIERSNDYRIVQVSEYGIVSAYNPITTRNQQVHTLVYLQAGEARNIYIPIIPDGPGNSTIKMCSHTFIGSNCEKREFKVIMNGVSNYYHHATLVDLTSKSEQLIWNFEFPTRQSFFEPEERRLRFVPDSREGHISVAGGVFGPTLSHKMPWFDMYKGMRLTHGALENVFFEYGVNIQLLTYLWNWKSEDHEAISDRAMDQSSVILEDCLTYFNSIDGGFGNFRDEKNNSNPLATAFAVWNLHSAISGLGQLRKRTHVPLDLLDRAVDYLIKNQVTVDPWKGSYETKDILNNMFLPDNFHENLTDIEKEAQKRIPVTAMVVMALSDKKSVGTDQITMATSFIKQHIHKTIDPFTQIIGTYAMTKGKSELSSDIEAMIPKIMKNSFEYRRTRYFSNRKVLLSMKRLINSGAIQKQYRLEQPNDAYTVASSSLAMMLLCEKNQWGYNSEETMNLMEFFADMRNHNNGFASTFDTLLAMRAMVQFTKNDKNRRLYKLFVEQSLTSNITWNREFFINNLTYSLGLNTSVPDKLVWGEVQFKSEGTGRILLQLETISKSFYDVLIKSPMDPDNTFNIMSSYNIYCEPIFQGRNSSIMTMTVCGNWAGHVGILPRPTAGMTVFEISIPTGFVILNDHLREIVQSKVFPTLRYAKFWPGRISLYLDDLGPRNTCITFMSQRYFPVANISRDQLCSAYNYYEPGRFNRTVYRVESLYSNHICNVFGSYQCPFSPFFNTAVSTAFTSWFTITITMTTLFLIGLYGNLGFNTPPLIMTNNHS